MSGLRSVLRRARESGASRAHVNGGLAGTFNLHAACRLAELGAYTGERRFTSAAELVDTRGCRSREELRARVDARLLSRQFYRLHRDLVPVLERRLSRVAS